MKDLVIGSNSIDANDVSYYNSKLKVIRFVASMNGTYTIGSDMVYSNGEMWTIFDDLANLSPMVMSNSDDKDVSVTFKAGKAYYFAFLLQSEGGKTDFTLTITAPAHTHAFAVLLIPSLLQKQQSIHMLTMLSLPFAPSRVIRSTPVLAVTNLLTAMSMQTDTITKMAHVPSAEMSTPITITVMTMITPTATAFATTRISLYSSFTKLFVGSGNCLISEKPVIAELFI